MATILSKSRFQYPSTTSWEGTDLETRERSRNHRKATALLSFVVFVISGVSVLWSIRPPDPCRNTTQPHTHVDFVIDATDRYSADQLRTTQGLISHYQTALPAGAHLSVHWLRPEGQEQSLQPLFSACKPPDGSKANPLFQSPHLMQRHYEETFEQPLQTLQTVKDEKGKDKKGKLAMLTEIEPAPRSPILEALYALVNPSSFSGQQRTLIIVSDMLQHNPESTLSHFSRGYRFEDIANSTYVRGVQGRLTGVRVEVYRLKNAYHAYRTPAHAAFWEQYFQAAGVAHYSVVDL